MQPPRWLAELHRQWLKARGGRLQSSTVYWVGWDKLLDAAHIPAADRAVAAREAEALKKQGRIDLKCHRYRQYIIEKLGLLPESEDWMHDLFGSVDAAQLRDQSVAAVKKAAELVHPRYPDLWARWCKDLEQSLAEGRNLPPFNWKQPGQMAELLAIVLRITEKEWAAGISIRLVSRDICEDSKALERLQPRLEKALSGFFSNSTCLEDLGIIVTNGHLWFSGPLVLHFEDGSITDFSASRDRYAIAETELSRAVAITTSAVRLLTVENEKATFSHLAAANDDRTTLLVASSFPTQALKELLHRLPDNIPHFHFGDTDPAGWLILEKMREASSRPVQPLHMRWQPASSPSPLTSRDQEILSNLITSSRMEDCKDELETMLNKNDRGCFEQESLGMPNKNWPFY